MSSNNYEFTTMDGGVEVVRSLIEEAKNPIMFFDCDSDGATSYLQLKKVFSKILGYPMLKNFIKQKNLVDNYLSLNVDLLLIFDIPYLLDDFLELVKNISPNCKIVWVDHHPTNSPELIKKYEIVNLNPLNFDDNDNRPVCYLSYLISGKKDFNLEFVVLGSIADYFLLDVIGELYKKNKKAFKVLFPKLKKSKSEELLNFVKEYGFNDKNSKILKERENWIKYLIYGAGLIRMKNFFDFMFKFKEDSDVLKAFKCIENYSLFDLNNEINANKGFLFENYNVLIEKYDKVLKKALNVVCDDYYYFFEYSSEVAFTKTLAEEICYKHPNTKVIGICFKKEGKQNYTCSFRGNGFVVNNLVSQALTGLDGYGGGHTYAAGMSVNARDFLEFKRRVEKKIRNK